MGGTKRKSRIARMIRDFGRGQPVNQDAIDAYEKVQAKRHPTGQKRKAAEVHP
jgi:hypothetical protein